MGSCIADMHSFAEFMAESFNSDTRLIWNYAQASVATASFKVDDLSVAVSFERRETAWYVVFEVDRGDNTAAVHSAFEIFNGVFQAVEEFLSVREPDTLIFATKRDKLAGIYQIYLRKETATLESVGYRLEGLTACRTRGSVPSIRH